MEARKFKSIPDLRCRPGDLRKGELLAGLPWRIELVTGRGILAEELKYLTRGQLKWIHLCLLRRRLFVPRVYEEIRVAKRRRTGERVAFRDPNPRIEEIRRMRARVTRELARNADEVPF